MVVGLGSSANAVGRGLADGRRSLGDSDGVAGAGDGRSVGTHEPAGSAVGGEEGAFEGRDPGCRSECSSDGEGRSAGDRSASNVLASAGSA